VCKAAVFVAAAVHDTLFTSSLPPHQQFDSYQRFVDTACLKKGALFGQDTLMVGVTHFRKKYPKASICFIGDGLGRNTEIWRSDPLTVLTEALQLTTEENDEGWIEVSRSARRPPQFIAYPFVYPSRGPLSFPHVVLIVVDTSRSIIYYYDPQGKTSDDPSRRELFRDAPTFNMHNNLVELAHRLFPQGAYVIENTAVHQHDPFNCGTLVLRALGRLYAGLPVEEALQLNPLTESASQYRRALGHDFLQANHWLEGNR
jgi:hypothetical protein